MWDPHPLKQKHCYVEMGEERRVANVQVRDSRIKVKGEGEKGV